MYIHWKCQLLDVLLRLEDFLFSKCIAAVNALTSWWLFITWIKPVLITFTAKCVLPVANWIGWLCCVNSFIPELYLSVSSHSGDREVKLAVLYPIVLELTEIHKKKSVRPAEKKVNIMGIYKQICNQDFSGH